MPLSNLSDTVLRALLQQFCETSFQAVLITTAEPGYPIVYANPAFCKMCGYTLAELVGESPRILQGERTNRNVLARLKMAIEQEAQFHGSAINYRKNGDAYPVEWTVSAIRNDNHQITHYLSLQKDLSHLKDMMSLFKQTNEHFREFLIDISRDNHQDIVKKAEDKRLPAELLENSRFYNPALRSQANVELFEQSEFFDFSGDMSGVFVETREHEPISAKQYSEKYNASLNVPEISQKITEILEGTDLLIYSKNPIVDLVDIAQVLKDVATDIFYLDEFFELSSVLTQLANHMAGYDSKKLEPFVVDTFNALAADLEHWLNVIFIAKSANDIHALDASMISSAKQLMMFLK
ncbi:MAG TPA: PAS domain-containing protein [Marinagarivorans sp.]